MLRGNKGEWSEIYTLLKLLGDTEICVGDKDLNKIPDLLYPIIKILRYDKGNHFEYNIKDKIIIIQNNKEILSININVFKKKAKFLLSKIKKHNQTFEIPEIESFLSKIKCSSLKSKSSIKTDIRIVLYDHKTKTNPELGFSIKSQLGSPSTLLNAGLSTNFIYEINGVLTDSIIEKINSIEGRSKIKQRVSEILKKESNLKYYDIEKDVFKNNLVLIDSQLPNILSEIVKEFYFSKNSKLNEIVNKIRIKNPLQYDLKSGHKYYEYKIKKLLTEVALGMMPMKVWDGVYDATGGYLIVKDNGDILAYHLYNKNEFENYLYYNTKLDTASSSRHKFGKIFTKNGKLFIKLNLQIRFIK